MVDRERNVDDDSYEEVEDSHRDQEEDCAYFPLEESKPPHY